MGFLYFNICSEVNHFKTSELAEALTPTCSSYSYYIKI